MGTFIDNPMMPIIVAGLVSGIGCALLRILVASSVVNGLAPPAVFLAVYYATYQKVPGFPAVGATNKLFYIALFTALPATSLVRKSAGALRRAVLASATSVLVAIWIAAPRLSQPDPMLFAWIAGVAVGGAVVLWLLDRIVRDSKGTPREALALSFLGATAVAFAPVALFGGSSTSLGLCLGFAAALGVVSLAALLRPDPVGHAAVLAGGACLAGVVDTVVLITQRADPIALTLVILPAFLGTGVSSLLPENLRKRAVLVWLISGICALAPLPLIVALLFLRHESPLGT